MGTFDNNSERWKWKEERRVRRTSVFKRASEKTVESVCVHIEKDLRAGRAPYHSRRYYTHALGEGNAYCFIECITIQRAPTTFFPFFTHLPHHSSLLFIHDFFRLIDPFQKKFCTFTSSSTRFFLGLLSGHLPSAGFPFSACVPFIRSPHTRPN